MERRDLLRAGAIAAAAAIAGCAEDDGEPADDGDDEPDDENGDDDAETEDDTADDLDDADDEGDGDDTDDTNGDDDEGDEDGIDADDEADDEEDTDDEETDDDADDADGAMFADTVEIEESYAFESEGDDGSGGTATSRGRIDGENTYVVIEEAGEEIEMYTVEGETYLVEGEECMALPGMAEDELEEGEPDDPDAEAGSHPDLEATGEETIDGEDVYVFEISGEEASEHDEDVTYYVSVETGYIRRIESGPSTTDFHSWGDVEPVEPPEMDCVDLGDFDEDDLPL